MIAAVVVVVVVGLAISSVRRFAPRQPVTQSDTAVVENDHLAAPYQPPGTDGFVGSGACATCHQDVADTFQSHPMAHSIERVTARDSEVTLSVDSAIRGNGIIFDVGFDNGNMFHRERRLDASGETIIEQAVQVQYSVGSGRRAKAYLAQRDNLLFMSPLNWYSESHRWDMAPGYSVDDPRRFERGVTDACLSCHAGRVAPDGPLPNRFKSEAFHEAAIGCENCHGPGKQHIEFHSGPYDAESSSQDPIVNPVDLDASRREAVCNQCHLQATVRLLRPGRSDFDFRPGDRMEDIWAVLDSGTGVDAEGRTQSVNHVQQMRDSTCFKQSGGRLGCTSCHDPHRVPSAEDRTEFYRQRCMTCHDDASCSANREERNRTGDSCVACHMPGRDTHNMSHVTQTDHRILRSPDRIGATNASEITASLAFFNDEKTILPEWEQQRALGIGAWIYLMKADQRPTFGVAQMLFPVVERIPRDGMTLLALGSIASLNAKRDLARGYLQSASEVPDAEEEALVSLLDLEYESGHWSQALAAADRLIEIDPWRAKTHALRADLLSQLGRLEEGIAAAERALELNPTLVPVREWLVNAYRVTAQQEEQTAQEDILRRLRESASGSTVGPVERDGGVRDLEP